MINYLDKPLWSCTHVYKDPDLVSQPRFLVSCVFVSSITFLTCHIGIFFLQETQEACLSPSACPHTGLLLWEGSPSVPRLHFHYIVHPTHPTPLSPGPSALPSLCPQPVLCPAPTPSSFHGQDSSFGRANSNTIAFVKPSQSFTKKNPLWSLFCSPSTGWGQDLSSRQGFH